MKILVTGATGGLGYRTLEKLIANPSTQKLVASGRTIKSSHFIENEKVNYILGNLEEKNFANKLVEGVDHVVHAAALSSPWGKYGDFEKANLHSMKNLIAASKLQKIKRFVYISTPGVYFNGYDRFNIRESEKLPEKFVNAYAKTKYEAELELERSGIPFVILRPRALIGRGDMIIMPRLIRALEEGKLKIIGNGNNLVDLTSLSNAADAIELALCVDPKGVNQTYNISNGEPVKLWEAVDQVLSQLGYEMKKQKISFSLVKLIARLMELRSKLTDNAEPALTVYGVGVLAKSFTMDISKARQLLGYVPNVSTGEAINEFVEWFKQHERS
jgi:nucleoside-diphosphate-sugar epimerase